MTIVTANTPEIVVSIDVPKVRRFSVEDYHQLLAVGFLQEGDRVELIQGELVDMAAKGTKHIFCCQELLAILPDRVREQAISRCQDPIILSANSEPEPDFAIVRLAPDRYRERKPQAEDVILVIEVSDSSLEYDRTVKSSLYAEAGIEHYWIFNVLDRQLEQLRSPIQLANGTYQYATRQIHLAHQTVNLPDPLSGAIVLAEVLA